MKLSYTWAAFLVLTILLASTVVEAAQRTVKKRRPVSPPVFIQPPSPPQLPRVFPPMPPLPSAMDLPMPPYVTQPKPIGEPASWFTKEDYPAAAKRAGEQGRVAIALAVSETGRPIGCSVTQSSGSQWLDQATCRLAFARGRFVAPLDSSGNPVRFLFPLATRWQLEDEDDFDFDLNGATVDVAKGPWGRVLISAVVDVDEQGKGVACRSGTIGVPNEVACDGFFVGRELMDPVLSGGKPVRATVTLSKSIRVLAKRPPK